MLSEHTVKLLFFINRGTVYALFVQLFLFLNALYVMVILSECYFSIIMQRRLVGVIHDNIVVLVSVWYGKTLLSL